MSQFHFYETTLSTLQRTMTVFSKNRTNFIIISIIICFLVIYYLQNHIPASTDLYNIKVLHEQLCAKSEPHSEPLTCDCDRSRKLPAFQELSTCDYYSTARGKHQKVVSYSFYGRTSSLYFQGVEQSIINVQNSYPGWVMRLYHNINISDSEENAVLCRLWCQYNYLDVCDARRLPYPLCDMSKVYGTLWRFFTLGDPFVDTFIVRDIDGPMIKREVDAVNDWLSKNKVFHIMRDHPFHSVPILAGMWGALNHNRDFMQVLRNDFISQGLNWTHGEDQNLLSKIVWPHVENNSVTHDSYLCKHFPHTSPFPTKRDQNKSYVGMIYGWRKDQEYPLTDPCPKVCRPPHHLDWNYC